MTKYLIKTIKINDNAKNGDQAVESCWTYVDSETIHTIYIFDKMKNPTWSTVQTQWGLG